MGASGAPRAAQRMKLASMPWIRPRQFCTGARQQPKGFGYKSAAGLFGAGVFGGACLYFDTSNKTLGLKRNIKFWLRAFPMYLHYRITEELVRGKSDEEVAAAYNLLHDRYAQPAVELCVEMGGYFYKSAQLVSTRDEFVPRQYMAWLKGLQDKAPPQRSAAEVRELIQDSLRQPLEAVFTRFDDEAIGAASVGQVHRAQLTTGEEVAVKVMYPNVETLFRADMRIISSFCWLAMPHHLPALREIEKQFASEFDYEREAANMQRIAKAINSHAYYSKHIFVPQPFPALCSRAVLVMQYVPGEKLVDGIRKSMLPMAQCRGITLAALEEEEKARIQREGLSSAAAAARRSRLLQVWAISSALAFNAYASLFNYSIALLRLLPPLALRPLQPPPNLPQLLELLLDVHGFEIFQLGCFNGDPHPGNILLLPDGRLGLIDYGSCVTLRQDHRRNLALLMISLCSPSHQEAVRVYSQDMGVRTAKMDPRILYKMAAFWYDRDTPDVTEGMNVHSFTEWLHQQDPVTFLPDEYVMIGRVSVLLRGMGAAFGVKLRTAQAWSPHARALLQGQA
jgi:aarF domain-containing kinase